MTMIAVYGKIFDPIRPNHSFFKCPLCVGFWIGIINAFILDSSFNWFTAGCISAGTSYMLAMLINDDGLKINKATFK